MKEFFRIFLLVVALPGIALSQENKIRVGVITALTGRMATIGTAVRNGIELARSDHPELFKNIEVIYEDDQFDGKQALAAYQRLKNNDHVSLIFGFGDTLAQVVGPLADQNKLPLINFNFDASSAAGRTYLIRAMNHTGQYMSALARYLQHLGYSKFSVVRDESPFFNSMAGSFKAAIGKSGAVEETAAFNPSDTDFRSAILKLKSAGTGPVGLFLSPDQLIEFLKQAKELRLEKVYFGTDLFETAAGISPDKALFEGCLYPDNNVAPAFRSRYRQEFGNEAQLTFAGSSYDMALLTAETLSDKNTGNPAELIDSFREVRGRLGVLGQFHYEEQKGFGKFFEFPVHVKRIHDTVGIPAGEGE